MMRELVHINIRKIMAQLQNEHHRACQAALELKGPGQVVPPENREDYSFQLGKALAFYSCMRLFDPLLSQERSYLEDQTKTRTDIRTSASAQEC